MTMAPVTLPNHPLAAGLLGAAAQARRSARRLAQPSSDALIVVVGRWR